MPPQKEKPVIENSDCFIIMPMSDPDGYDKGHFKHVYNDIFRPACEKAGYVAVRGDDVKQTNLIHLDILKKLLDSPIAICDLSSRNPNVLFELGLRQAFDKPTVLVQEIETPKIFDISPLRYTEYRKNLKYREVLEDQNSIADAIKATIAAEASGEGVNSIISLLSITRPASLKDATTDQTASMMQFVVAEINALRDDFRKSTRESEPKRHSIDDHNIAEREYSRARMGFNRFKSVAIDGKDDGAIREKYEYLHRRAEAAFEADLPPHRKEILRSILSEADTMMANYIIHRNQLGE